VCKEQGRIHQSMLNSDYYGFQRHEGELQPSICTASMFRGLASPFGVAAHCHTHCCARVAQGIRSILTYRCPYLPPVFTGSRYNVTSRYSPVANCNHGSCSLPDLTGHLTARADDGHALPLGSSDKVFSLIFILPSPLVRFPVLNRIKPHAAPVVVLPRQFL
jgi:hypothetical protein